jgi:hypothetical protein
MDFNPKWMYTVLYVFCNNPLIKQINYAVGKSLNFSFIWIPSRENHKPILAFSQFSILNYLISLNWSKWSKIASKISKNKKFTMPDISAERIHIRVCLKIRQFRPHINSFSIAFSQIFLECTVRINVYGISRNFLLIYLFSFPRKLIKRPPSNFLRTCANAVELFP